MIQNYEEAVHEAILGEKHNTATSLHPRAKKRTLKNKNTAAKRIDGIGVLLLQTARVKALSRFTKRVVGKSIVGEVEARLRLPSTEEDIVDIMERKADREADRVADRQENTAVVKRKGKARVIRQRVTMKAEILVDINRRDVVGNIHRRTRNIVGNGDLPVRRRAMKRTVRRTENGDHAVQHSGGFYFVFFLCLFCFVFFFTSSNSAVSCLYWYRVWVYG